MPSKQLFVDGSSGEVWCPRCVPTVRMVVRTNKQSGAQFLGCPNWPECAETREIPESWRMRALGQQELDLFGEGGATDGR